MLQVGNHPYKDGEFSCRAETLVYRHNFDKGGRSIFNRVLMKQRGWGVLRSHSLVHRQSVYKRDSCICLHPEMPKAATIRH